MKIKKFFCFLIPELSNKYYLFIGFVIGSLCRKCIPGILSDYVLKTNKTKKNFEQEKRGKYYDILSNICSDLLVGIIHFILIKKEKETNKKEFKKEKSVKISFIFNDETHNKKLFFQLFFLLSIIDFFCELCFYYGCHTNKTIIDNEEKKLHKIDYLVSFLVVDIVARYIFSRIILNTNFYFHHYVSFFINVVILLIVFLVEFFYKMKEYSIYFLLISFFQYILYSLEDIINKLILIKLYIYPESLLFYKGLFTFIYFILFTIFVAVFKDVKLYNDFNAKAFVSQLFIKLIYISFNILRSIFLVKVIDIFSSQHISFLKVLETISLFFYYYFDNIYKKNNKKYSDIDDYFNNDDEDNYTDLVDLVEIMSCFILLLSSLIHNEIIILNCYKLKRNTKYFLSIEANLENLGLLSKNTEIMSMS